MEELSFSGELKYKGWHIVIWHKVYCEVRGAIFSIYDLKGGKKKIEKEIPITIHTEISTSCKGQKGRLKVKNPGEVRCHTFSGDMNLIREWAMYLRAGTFQTTGVTMEDFEIQSVIGRGFYGKVMLCKNKKNGGLYAIKTIRKTLLIQNDDTVSIFRERNILSQIRHPFIVSLFFAYQTKSKFYIGLEYASGGDLFKRIRNPGIPFNDVRLYVAEIALALQHLHNNGIIYRDLKPENVMLDESGHIKLTDFGLAKNISETGTTKTMCGTSDYIAPEIVQNVSYSFPIDWWALGVLTYEMCFKKTPFKDANRANQYKRIVNETPNFPDDTDSITKDFILKLLEKNPQKRASLSTLIDHKFFKGMNFADIKEKKISPSFIPKQSNGKPIYFDKIFTNEEPQDSIATPQTNFSGFEYNCQVGKSFIFPV
ncbi:RAC family serine/threonine-protein kinase like protein [Tritrichomonas foetus]|uniref:RAC family serine/threonine-protein kinase like protein n=1 Tax=Tritrichomonas foetus TaxID=1144522 RepID=A0A1J4KG88_9EUKA|nr:RAC family serine/threonine-protein kinase like protein [Tritrichomonas foetus]|eukprot:OHT08662.1 RAC family serine/threonine-protein kinase like protein [Tritrichomonas foetus]